MSLPTPASIALCSASLAFRSVHVLPSCQSCSSGPPWRILQMINAGQGLAVGLTPWLVRIPNTQLTVTVGRDEKLQRKVELIRDASAQKFTIIGWTTELPQLLASHHILVSKAGGATVQERQSRRRVRSLSIRSCPVRKRETHN